MAKMRREMMCVLLMAFLLAGTGTVWAASFTIYDTDGSWYTGRFKGTHGYTIDAEIIKKAQEEPGVFCDWVKEKFTPTLSDYYGSIKLTSPSTNEGIIEGDDTAWAKKCHFKFSTPAAIYSDGDTENFLPNDDGDFILADTGPYVSGDGSNTSALFLFSDEKTGCYSYLAIGLYSGGLSLKKLDNGGIYFDFTGGEPTELNIVCGQSCTAAPVPIPGALWLLGSGLLGLFGIRRRRHN